MLSGQRTLKKNEMVLGNPVHIEAIRNKLEVSGAPAGIAIPALRKIEYPPSKESWVLNLTLLARPVT